MCRFGTHSVPNYEDKETILWYLDRNKRKHRAFQKFCCCLPPLLLCKFHYLYIYCFNSNTYNPHRFNPKGICSLIFLRKDRKSRMGSLKSLKSHIYKIIFNYVKKVQFLSSCHKKMCFSLRSTIKKSFLYCYR